MTRLLAVEPQPDQIRRACDGLTEAFFGFHVAAPQVYLDWLETPTANPDEMDMDSPNPDNPYLAEARQQLKAAAEQRRREHIAAQKTQARHIRQRAKQTGNPLVIDALALIAREQGLYQYVSKVIAANDRRVAARIRRGVTMRHEDGAQYWVTSANFYKKLWKEGFRECPKNC